MLTKSFLRREDPALTDKLLAEAPGIFNWALAGLDRLNERGYFVQPESAREAVRQLEDLSSPVSAFVRDYCEVGANQRVYVDKLWDAWKLSCHDDNRHPGTKAVFGRNLNAAVPMIRKARPRDGQERTYVYEGIGLVRTGRNTLDRTQDRPDRDASGPSGPGSTTMYSRKQEDSASAPEWAGKALDDDS